MQAAGQTLITPPLAASLICRYLTIMDSRGSDTILLIEDDESVLEFVSTILKEFGYPLVLKAKSAASARILWLQQHERIMLVIADLTLPDGSGAEFVKNIAADTPVPAILMTGFLKENVTLMSRGVVVLEKPFAPQNLFTLVNKMISQSKRTNIAQRSDQLATAT